MKFSREIETFLKDYLKELQEDNAVIFAGAGLSASSGYVNWKNLLRDFAEELELQIDRETDLVMLAQHYLNKHMNNRHALSQKIANEFQAGKKPNANHEILARLPIRTYWTTNYDKLIERSLEDAGKIHDTKYTDAHLARTIHGRDAIIYKMHGDVDHADQSILSKDQYEKYYSTHGAYINALSGDLVSKLFLFIGFSFTDPNLDYVLSRIRVTFKDNQRHHYCIFKEVSKEQDETEEDFNYRKLKQQLAIHDLKRFNIRTLLVDDYPVVTEILQELERRYRHSTIFISGSAYEYGDWEVQEAEAFVANLSKALIQNGYSIVSGFGLGIGSSVIHGVLEEVYINQQKTLKGQLLLRPFPQGEKSKEQWDTYRRDMIAYAGIGIFMFGNKLVDGKVVPADGVQKEFEIAKEKGLLLIPIGVTGSVAQTIWNEMNDRFKEYFGTDDNKELFNVLNEETKPEELIKGILNFIKSIQAI